jgi:hypothetical protein
LAIDEPGTVLQIYSSFFGGTNSQLRDVLTELMQELFEMVYKHRERSLWIRVGRCLGELGAIDPSRIGFGSKVDQVHNNISLVRRDRT